MSREDIQLLLSLLPLALKEVPQRGLDPTFYVTGSYWDDLILYDKIQTIRDRWE